MDKKKKLPREKLEEIMRERYQGIDQCMRKNIGLREVDYQPSYGKLK